MAINYRSDDGLNETPVSNATPLPVTFATGSVATVVSVAGAAGSDGSSTITAGGTAQNMFGAATPTNGFEVCNVDLAEDLWISLSTTAAPNAAGSIRIAPNGGCYSSPPGMKPFHAISIYGATTGHKFTATQW
jgi:hypothetical protein